MKKTTPKQVIPCQKVRNFYEKSYKELGFNAQRKYPNEELCRFMGRNFFHLPVKKRKDVKILETGCGSGANLWMLAKEGFDAYGIDLSQEALMLTKKMLDQYNVNAKCFEQNMTQIDFPENFFDAIVDVFSSYCLIKKEHLQYLTKVKTLLKPNGLFFSYFPSKISDTFLFPQNAPLIDSDTLKYISRKDSPFYKQNYPFRFIHSREYEDILKHLGFTIKYSETVIKTYRMQQERFGFVVIEAIKT